MKHLFHSAAQQAVIQDAYNRADIGTGQHRNALRVALTDNGQVVAFTASPDDYLGGIKNYPVSVPGSAFDDMEYVGTISSEEQILVSEDGVTPAGYTFAAHRNILATVESITAQAENLEFRNNNRVPDPRDFNLF